MKTRALLSIIISLVTGFLIGFIVSSQITRLRTRDVRSISSAESFKMRTYNLINPTSDQIKELDPVIDEYSERFDSMRKVSHQGFKILIEEYHNSLSPYLTEDQNEVLQDFAKKLRDKKHHNKDTDKEENKE